MKTSKLGNPQSSAAVSATHGDIARALARDVPEQPPLAPRTPPPTLAQIRANHASVSGKAEKKP